MEFYTYLKKNRDRNIPEFNYKCAVKIVRNASKITNDILIFFSQIPNNDLILCKS